MKRYVILLIIVLPLFCAAQPIRFNKIYNYDQHFRPYGSLSRILGVTLNQNDFIVAGMVFDDSNVDNRTTFIAGMDYNGTRLWQKNLTFAGSYNFLRAPTAVISSIDSNRFVVAGARLTPFARANMDNFYQPFIHIFSRNGDSLHFRELHDTVEPRQFNSVCVTSDKKILAAGQTLLTTASYDGVNPYLIPDSAAIYLVKFDTTGQKIWERRLFRVKRATAIDSVGNDPVVWNLIPTPDGGALMSVAAKTPYWIRPSSCLMQLDSSGNVQWTKLYPANAYFSLPILEICKARGGGYYFLSGMATKPPQSGNVSAYNSILVYGRLNDNGDTVWTKHFAMPGEYDGYTWTEAYKIKQDNNGRLLILAGAADTVTWNSTLIRADSNGKILSYRQYDYKDYQPFTQNLFTLDVTPKNNILMGGYIENYDSASFDTLGNYGWLVQTDSLGCMVPGCALADTVWQHLSVAAASPLSYVKVYPNPSNGYLTIEGMNAGGKATMLSIVGQQVMSIAISGNKQVLNLSSLPAGSYLLMLTSGDGAKGTIMITKE